MANAITHSQLRALDDLHEFVQGLRNHCDESGMSALSLENITVMANRIMAVRRSVAHGRPCSFKPLVLNQSASFADAERRGEE